MVYARPMGCAGLSLGRAAPPLLGLGCPQALLRVVWEGLACLCGCAGAAAGGGGLLIRAGLAGSVAWAPNDTPRPTANTSHTPYSRAHPQTTPHVIPAHPHTSLTLCPRCIPPPHRIHTPLWENVLFGHVDDEVRFRMVVRACMLTQDLEMLPQGDCTESGEKGINLRCTLVRCAMN